MTPLPLPRHFRLIRALLRARRAMADQEAPAPLRRARSDLAMAAALSRSPALRADVMGKPAEGWFLLPMMVGASACLVGFAVSAGLKSWTPILLALAATALSALPLAWSVLLRSARPFMPSAGRGSLERFSVPVSRLGPDAVLSDLALALGEDRAALLLARLEADPAFAGSPEGQEILGRALEAVFLSAPTTTKALA